MSQDGYQWIADPRIRDWVYDCLWCGRFFFQGPTTGPNTGVGNMGQSYGLSVQCPHCGSTNTSGPRKLTSTEMYYLATTPSKRKHTRKGLTVKKDLSLDSFNMLIGIFGYNAVAAWSPEQQSVMWQLVDQIDKTSDWVSFKVEAENAISSASDEGQNYLVWQTAEDEVVCGYCQPLDMKIVSGDELDTMDMPPAHVNCRCTLVPVSERYGRDVPIMYYHAIPTTYDQWERGNQGPIHTSRIELDYLPELMKGWVTIRGRHIFYPDEEGISEGMNFRIGKYVDAEKSRLVSQYVEKLPKTQTRLVKELTLSDKDGPEFALGAGNTGVTQGDTNLETGRIRLFGVNDMDDDTLKETFDHEVHHLVWHDFIEKNIASRESMSPEEHMKTENYQMMRNFTAAVMDEGATTYYAGEYEKSKPQVFIAENFTETGRALRNDVMTDEWKVEHSKTIEAYKAIMKQYGEE